MYVHLKDSIFEQSSPSRHGTELMYDMRDLGLLKTGDLLSMPTHLRSEVAVVLKYHDGGTDHNISYASVRCKCIAEFLLTGVDMLVSMRCVPEHSWTNSAERVI